MIEGYKNKISGEKYVLFGFVNLMRKGICIDCIVVYHPENHPNLLYAVNSQEFNELFEKWKQKTIRG